MAALQQEQDRIIRITISCSNNHSSSNINRHTNTGHRKEHRKLLLPMDRERQVRREIPVTHPAVVVVVVWVLFHLLHLRQRLASLRMPLLRRLPRILRRMVNSRALRHPCTILIITRDNRPTIRLRMMDNSHRRRKGHGTIRQVVQQGLIPHHRHRNHSSSNNNSRIITTCSSNSNITEHIITTCLRMELGVEEWGECQERL